MYQHKKIALFSAVIFILVMSFMYQKTDASNVTESELVPSESETKEQESPIFLESYIVKTNVSVSTNLEDVVVRNEISQGIALHLSSETSFQTKPTVETYFNMLPENVRKSFKANGWVYKKVNYNLGKAKGFGTSILGLTEFYEKVVYIDRREKADSSILHEMGHVFGDHIFWENQTGTLGCYSKEFISLWESHYLEWHEAYGQSIENYNTLMEGYAQCFEIYILKPECLDEDTRNFIANEIASIS